MEKQPLWIFRPQAKKKSDIETERERQELLWASGKEMDPMWRETLKREQEAIMHGIEVERKKKTSSTTLNGSHDASLLPASSRLRSLLGPLLPTPPATPKLDPSQSKYKSHPTVSKLGSNKHGTGGRSQIADSSSLLTAETSLRPPSSIRSDSYSDRPPSPSTRSPSASVHSSSHWSSRIPHHSEDIILPHRTTMEDRPLGSIGGRASHDEPPFVVQLPNSSKISKAPRPPRSSTSSSDFKLAKILKDKALYRRLLSCSKPEAQIVLEVLQMLLDSREKKVIHRRQLITAMRRISKKTWLFPSCFNIYGPIEVPSAPATGSRSADVYKAQIQNERQNEWLCLKKIRTFQNSPVERIAKIYAREAITWGQQDHPNVLPFYGIYRYQGWVLLVSPWAENGHLGDYLKQDSNLNLNPAPLCLDAATGLEYLHRQSIVHGDLKAANVLIDRSGRACLSDLGLSSVTDLEILHWTSESSAASRGGTPMWQAPELHGEESDNINSGHNSEASDVWAWACLCYEAYTGKFPFYDIRNPSQVIIRIMKGKHPTKPLAGDPAWTRRGLTTGIWKILEDCWNPDPKKRPNISMVIERLKSDLPVDTRPPPQWQGGRAREFRYQQSQGVPYRQPTLEDLDVILSRILP